MPPRRGELTASQLSQVREVVAEEIGNAFRELMPDIVKTVVDEMRVMIIERSATTPHDQGGPVRDAARRGEIELELQEKKRKALVPASQSSGSQKKHKSEDKRFEKKFNYKPSSGGGRKPVICFKCQQEGHTIRDCKAEVETCYHCHETGHIRPDCPKLKTQRGSGRPRPMMTRDRVHQFTAETPAVNSNVAGKP